MVVTVEIDASALVAENIGGVLEELVGGLDIPGFEHHIRALWHFLTSIHLITENNHQVRLRTIRLVTSTPTSRHESPH